MKAVVCTHYGPPQVLRVKELATPVPRKNEVRIRIRATAVTSLLEELVTKGEIAPVIDRANPPCDRL